MSGCGRGSEGGTAATRATRARPSLPVRRPARSRSGRRGRQARRDRQGLRGGEPEGWVNVTVIPSTRRTTRFPGSRQPDPGREPGRDLARVRRRVRRQDSHRPHRRVQVLPGAWGTTSVDGTSYGVPWYVETRLIYYRTDLAEKPASPEARLTQDDFKAFRAMETSARDGVLAARRHWLRRRSCRSRGRTAPSCRAVTSSFDSAEMTQTLDYYKSFFTDNLCRQARSRCPRAGSSRSIGSFVRPVAHGHPA